MNTGYITSTWKWRKQKPFIRRCPERDYLYQKSIQREKIGRALSDPTLSLRTESPPVIRSATSDNFFNEKNAKRKKQLRFCEAVNVVLIPSLEEYRLANYSDMLWWRPFHYIEFKRSALEEIRDIIRSQKAQDVKTAMAIMYQSDNDLGLDTSVAAA